MAARERFSHQVFPLAWGEGNESNKPLYNNWHCEYVSPRVGEGNERLPSGSGSSNEMVFPLALGEGNERFVLWSHRIERKEQKEFVHVGQTLFVLLFC